MLDNAEDAISRSFIVVFDILRKMSFQVSVYHLAPRMVLTCMRPACAGPQAHNAREC